MKIPNPLPLWLARVLSSCPGWDLPAVCDPPHPAFLRMPCPSTSRSPLLLQPASPSPSPSCSLQFSRPQVPSTTFQVSDPGGSHATAPSRATQLSAPPSSWPPQSPLCSTSLPFRLPSPCFLLRHYPRTSPGPQAPHRSLLSSAPSLPRRACTGVPHRPSLPDPWLGLRVPLADGQLQVHGQKSTHDRT